jgi:hypothetical protein
MSVAFRISFISLLYIAMEVLLIILGLAIWAGQVMAIIVCCKSESPKWLRVCGAIGSILFLLAFL